MTKHTGVKGLSILFTSKVTMDAAKEMPGGESLMAKAGAQIANLAAHFAEGQRRATQSIDLIRASSGYDPAKDGATDDQIADKILAAYAARVGAK